jgi:hypothetical protein
MSRGKPKQMVDVIHNAPGKKGKQEYRSFESIDEAFRFVEQQTNRTHGKPSRVSGGYMFRYRGTSSPESCVHKVKYPRADSALRAAVAMSRKTATEIEPYKCPHCDGWHVGHPPQIHANLAQRTYR